ncbi:MAG: hypothetical protein AUG51_22355 [Acidobacteria bacterium 13_1_20CM_3_53_8]|nr:MAG: hypothetical protein AUG51_22355 [Acidobacteria bacterium 13_1_20CM_3_53_8]
MIEDAIDEKELAFLNELAKYEDKWVAIANNGGEETIVGSGDDAVEAMREAEEKGFPDAALLKLRRFDRAYVPTLLT